MSDTIWLYWEGHQPAYISLCCRTVFAHNRNVVMLDRSSFDDLFTTDRDIDIDGLAPNHRSDFIRAYLLLHYGGLYLDADCVVLRDLSPLLEVARQVGFVGYREPQGYMSCNFMASHPGGEVMAEHYARVSAAIRSGRQLEWLDLASVPMEAAVRAHPGRAVLLPTESIMPLPWNDSAHLSVRRSDDEHERCLCPDAYCYMLSNNTIKTLHETRTLWYLPEAELLQDHSFLAFLLRQALGHAPIRMDGVAPYLGGHEDKTQLDEGALDYLASCFGVRSMIDVGCGPGGMIYYARSRGIDAVGVDGDSTVVRASSLIIEHDYTTGPLTPGEFDLGWSVEFLEHVGEQYIPNFMATFRCCKHVFLTAAVPGQQGYHHVNCQWGDYWIARFAEAGFTFDPVATDGVRRHSTMWSRFTEQTGLVFTRNDIL